MNVLLFVKLCQESPAVPAKKSRPFRARRQADSTQASLALSALGQPGL
jgi:hypothetical protein